MFYLEGKTLKKQNIIFTLIIIVLTFQISGCAELSKSKEAIGKTAETIALEKSYQQLIEVIKKTDWGKAELNDWENVSHLIEELRSYRDTSMLARYVSYYKYLKENEIDKAIGVANNIPEDYAGNLREEIIKIKSEAKMLAKAQDLKYYQELIRKEDFKTLRKITAEKNNLDAEYNAIYNYLSALEYQEKGIRSAMIISLSHISMPYNGLLSEEITNMVNENSGEIRLMKNLLSGQTSAGKPKPYIGMTKEEVLATSWGKPSQVMSSLTPDGQEEQWEYPLEKTIFIENGFVTAIKN
jgi:hypothetical protein